MLNAKPQKNNMYKRGIKLLIALLIIVNIAAWLQNCGSEKSKEATSNEKHPPINLEKQYLGSESCALCHQKEFQDWQNSHHDLAMQVATAATLLADFKGETFTNQGVTSTFFQKEGNYYVNTEGPDGKNHDYQIKYVFGTYPLQQYLVKFPKGKLQCLRTAWDSKQNKWFDLYPTLDIDHQEWLHWSRGGLNWNTMCSDCHSTYVTKNFNAETQSYNTTFKWIDVSCEACHGPGETHVKAVESLKEKYRAKSDLKLTSSISSKEQVDQCARCHARRTQIAEPYDHQGEFMDFYIPEILMDNIYHADGQINKEVYVYGSYIQSKMYHNKVACSSCHDPHSLELKLTGNALCLECHEGNYNTPTHHFHPMETSSSQCVNCHMPGKYYMGNDFRRDHSFRVPRPDLSVKYGNPNACTGCHEDKSYQWAANQVVEWYGTKRIPHYSEALLAGNAQEPDAANNLVKLIKDISQPAIARATAIWYLNQIPGNEYSEIITSMLKDKENIVRYTAGSSMLNWSVNDKLTILPLLEDSVHSVRNIAASVLANIPKSNINAKWHQSYDKSMYEYLRALELRSDFPGGQLEAGVYYNRRGEIEKAEDAYKKAIELDNLNNHARINLAYLYNQQENNPDAIKLFKIVIKQEPQYGPAYYSLGMLYAEEGNMQEAEKYLSQAAKHTPNNPRVYYNWAISLQQLGKIKESENAYRAGLHISPEDADILYALAVLYIQNEELEKLKPIAIRLNKLYPNTLRFSQLMKYIKK